MSPCLVVNHWLVSDWFLANVTQMFKQAFGVIKTAAQCQGRNNLSIEELLSYAMCGFRLTALWVPGKPRKRRARLSSDCDIVDLMNAD